METFRRDVCRPGADAVTANRAVFNEASIDGCLAAHAQAHSVAPDLGRDARAAARDLHGLSRHRRAQRAGPGLFCFGHLQVTRRHRDRRVREEQVRGHRDSARGRDLSVPVGGCFGVRRRAGVQRRGAGRRGQLRARDSNGTKPAIAACSRRPSAVWAATAAPKHRPARSRKTWAAVVALRAPNASRSTAIAWPISARRRFRSFREIPAWARRRNPSFQRWWTIRLACGRAR